MELKIEDLKVGDELVCIDRDGFLNERRNAEYLLHNKMIVTDVNEHETYLLCEKDEKSCRNYIYSHELKYFKKKEQSQYTFDDLIDVAKKANKDRVINGFSVVGDVLNCRTLDDEDFNLGIGMDVLHGIQYLQSLYKETFVIETEDDLDRFNKDVEITLANDEKLSWEDLKSIGLMNTHAIFKALKGATVTQSK